MVPGLLGLLALLGAGAGGAGAPPAPLRFRNGTLRLLQFADLHYGAAGAAAEREAARQQRRPGPGFWAGAGRGHWVVCCQPLLSHQSLPSPSPG